MTNVIGWKDVKLSEEGQKKVAAMQPGQLMVVAVKHVNIHKSKTPKVQVELAEKVVIPGRNQSALGLLNAGDPNFSSGARRYWATANASQVKEYFGVEISDDESHKEFCKLVQPLANGNRFAIQVVEAVESQLPQNIIEYKEYYEKRRGADGPQFMTENGQPIYTYTNLVVVPEGERVIHTILEGTYEGDTGTSALRQPAISQSMKDALNN